MPHSFFENISKYLTSAEHRKRRFSERLVNYAHYIRSPKTLLYKLKARAAAQAVLDTPEMRLAKQTAASYGHIGWGFKYSRLPRYVELNLRRVYELDLHKGPPRSVLDIGAGAGFFLYLGKRFGNEMLGFDCVADDFYTGIHKSFAVDCRNLAVHAFTPLPDFGRRFDLITAFAVCFHVIEDNFWTHEAWKFFIDDLLTNQLNPTGIIHLHLNDAPSGARAKTIAHIRQHFPEAEQTLHSIRIRRS